MSLECHGGDDVEEERKRGEVKEKEKFTEREIVMGHGNNVGSLTYCMYNNHKTYTTFIVYHSMILLCYLMFLRL